MEVKEVKEDSSDNNNNNQYDPKELYPDNDDVINDQDTSDQTLFLNNKIKDLINENPFSESENKEEKNYEDILYKNKGCITKEQYDASKCLEILDKIFISKPDSKGMQKNYSDIL